jgi:ribosomal protein L40E
MSETGETMNDPDETKRLNKARAHAEYLASAKKRMETASIDELLSLVRKGSGELAYFAGEELATRIERNAEFADCHTCGIAYPATATHCTKCGGKLQARR